MKRRSHILLFFCLLYLGAKGQNLVPNPSFEQYTACPDFVSQLPYATDWWCPADQLGTSDYFNRCGQGTFAGVPQSLFAYLEPATGDAYAGIFCWRTDTVSYREYLQTRLSMPLEAGHTYCVSLKCSWRIINYNGMLSPVPASMVLDALGMYLSAGPIPRIPTWLPIAVTPQYQEPVSVSSSGWTQLGFSYTASGGEQYLTIGNFRNNVDVRPVHLPLQGICDLYYFVDDVEVVDCSSGIRANGSGSICLGQSTRLWVRGGQNYTWVTATDPNTPIGYGDSITVSPTVTTTYYVYSGNTRDSVTVQVRGPVPTVRLGNDTTVCEEVFRPRVQNPLPGVRYTWSNAFVFGPVGMVFASGTYVVLAELQGCMAMDTIEVTMKPIPYVALGPDRGLCPGQSITLSAAYGASTYRWQDGSVNPVYTVTSAGTYSVILNLDGCERGDTIQVTDAPAPVFDLGNDTTVCANENLLLEASVPGAVFRWQDQSGGMTHRPLQSGTYWVEATLGTCTASDTIRVTVNPVPDVDLGPDQGLCPGQTRTLDVGIPGAVYVWQDQFTGSVYTVTAAGLYSVTVSLGECSAGDSITITASPDPDFELGPDVQTCEGTPVVLNASVPGATYVWQDLSGGSTFHPSQSGVYRVEVTLGECSLIDSVTVVFHPLPSVNLGADSTACEGATVLLDASAPGFLYRWQDESTQATYNVTQPGNYTVEVTDSNGCKNKDAVRIGFDVPLSFQFPDSVLCYGNVWVLDIGNEKASCVWQDKSTGPRYTVAEAGTYLAVAHNACGTRTDTVTVGYRRCDCGFYIPQAFTPDRDGINERFGAVHNVECNLDEYEFTVFDRWGGVLFATRDIQFSWDGRAGGQTLPIGVYAYRIVYRFQNMPLKTEWGSVLLLR